MNIHIKSIIAALSFSTLFYNKAFGLNVFLISIITLLLLISLRKSRPVPWTYVLPYLFTAFMVFIEPSGFCIFAHLIALLFLTGQSITVRSSSYLLVIIGLINLLMASIINWIDSHQKPKQERKRLSPKVLNYIKGGLITATLLLLFGLLYRTANPIFEDLVAQIDFGFISFPWVFFTLMGYILFIHLMKPYYPQALIDFDLKQSNALLPSAVPLPELVLKKLNGEHTWGSMVFFTLNLLLAFFLITDFIYLLEPKILSNADYSESVHKGVYALMFSFICAIAIILYFFRGDLNFYEGDKSLRRLAYTWILFNMVLISFTFMKNWSYVEALGLTYKRIGVFVYLLLCLTGLVITYIKVAKKRSFIYLLRMQVSLFFFFLMVSTAVPWDRAITRYNLFVVENPDMAYLIHLGDSNSQQLYDYAHASKNKVSAPFMALIKKKHLEFTTAQSERTWQEYTLYQIYSRK